MLADRAVLAGTDPRSLTLLHVCESGDGRETDEAEREQAQGHEHLSGRSRTQLEKSFHGRMTAFVIHGRVAGASRERRAHSGCARGVQLADDVGHEEYAAGASPNGACDEPVAVRRGLRSSRRIEIPGEKPREIAGRRMAKQQLLRENAPGRKNAETNAALVPGLERRQHVRKDLASQLTAAVAFLPDQPLELLERRR